MSKDHSDAVQKHFTNEWEEYDLKICKAIPFYKESFNTLTSIIIQSGLKPERILEIGVGTGNLTRQLLKRFPSSSILGIDLVDRYLLQAKQKLEIYKDRINLEVKDINEFVFNEKYDLVVSSYVFHHIENSAQNSIYNNIFAHLNSGGMFINADFIDSSSSYFSNLFDQLRIQYMRNQGLCETSIKSDYIEHRKLEIPMPLEKQMQFLTQIGFKDVECFWKYLNLAVFGGVK